MKKVCMMVTNPVTNDTRVINEASSLALNGYEVTILATKASNTASEERIKGFKIKRLSRKYRSYSIFGRLGFTLRFTLAAFNQKAEVYHSHDLNTLLECYIAAKLRRAKIIYDSHEVCVDPQVHNLVYRLYSLIEKLLIGRVDAVITVNSYIAKYLEDRYHLNKHVFVVMSCPPLKQDVSSINIVKNSICLDKLRAEKQKNKKIILYQGVINEERCLKQLIEAMNYLPEDYCLFIIGEGDFLPELEALTLSNGLSEKVFFPGVINVEMLPACTKFADIGVTLVAGKRLNHYYSSPNKLFQYIHAGIPIIAQNFPFLREVIEGYDIGCLVDNIEPAQIAAAIRSTMQDERRYSIMKANTIVARERYNLEEESKVLLEVYRKIDVGS